MQADRGEITRSLWMDAGFVVGESLRGLEAGRLFVIPGWRYRMIVRLIALIPRGLMQLAARRVRKPRRVGTR